MFFFVGFSYIFLEYDHFYEEFMLWAFLYCEEICLSWHSILIVYSLLDQPTFSSMIHPFHICYLESSIHDIRTNKIYCKFTNLAVLTSYINYSREVSPFLFFFNHLSSSPPCTVSKYVLDIWYVRTAIYISDVYICDSVIVQEVVEKIHRSRIPCVG